MKILKEYPPKHIWDAVIGHGMKPDPATTIFTYGDTIYVLGGAEVPDHLIVHEETHMWQQAAMLPPEERTEKNLPLGADIWWSRYIDDQFFRIEQETEAYANQYAFICKTLKDREKRNKVLLELARILSGPTYGNVIGQQAAYQRIKSKANVK